MAKRSFAPPFSSTAQKVTYSSVVSSGCRTDSSSDERSNAERGEMMAKTAGAHKPGQGCDGGACGVQSTEFLACKTALLKEKRNRQKQLQHSCGTLDFPVFSIELFSRKSDRPCGGGSLSMK